MDFLEALSRPPVVLGVDPRPELHGREPISHIRRYTLELLEALASRLAAVKFQLAFFEALGPEGLGLLWELASGARVMGLPVIFDGKRGDIGSTAKAYARAYLEAFPGSALTANPYLGLDALERFWHSDHGLPPLVEIALVHYQFEAIHPFLDGNGRMGRLLITLMLLERGLLPEPALYLSAYFERHRTLYYDLLLGVSQRGAWEDWLAFFLEGVRTEAKDVAERARRLLDLWREWRERYGRKGGSAHILGLLDLLFERPVLTVPLVKDRLGITHAWANRLVQRLEEDGILTPVSERKRNRLYAAKEILEILEEARNA